MNTIIDDSLELKPVASSRSVAEASVFEDAIARRFEPYIGMPADDIADRLGLRTEPQSKELLRASSPSASSASRR